MQIEFVNHASFVCEHNGVRLICDPWLYGSAFNDGWDLIVESRFTADQFANVNYIWFSHEHPDHFSPRVLMDVPAELRPKITVLYKQTPDQKVLKFCTKLGFATLELPDGQRTELGSGLTVLCRKVPLHDSWLMIEAGGQRILNLNDAVLERPRELRALREELGEIELLFTQFSYAAWRGNREDTAVRRADARKKLDIMQTQIRYLRPKFTVPFASFSFFSHEENSFTNDAANTPSVALAAIEQTDSRPIVMYPGDRWQVGDVHDNASAIARYKQDYALIGQRPLRKSTSVPLETLKVQAKACIERIETTNDRRMLAVLRKNPVFPLLGPIEIYLWDLDCNVRFSFEHGLEPITWRPAKYDLRMASDSLHFVLKNSWGIDTLTVSGRFSADAAGLKQLVATFGLDALNNTGIRVTPSFLLDSATIGFAFRIIARKLWSLKAKGRATSEPSASVGA